MLFNTLCAVILSYLAFKACLITLLTLIINSDLLVITNPLAFSFHTKCITSITLRAYFNRDTLATEQRTSKSKIYVCSQLNLNIRYISYIYVLKTFLNYLII